MTWISNKRLLFQIRNNNHQFSFNVFRFVKLNKTWSNLSFTTKIFTTINNLTNQFICTFVFPCLQSTNSNNTTFTIRPTTRATPQKGSPQSIFTFVGVEIISPLDSKQQKLFLRMSFSLIKTTNKMIDTILHFLNRFFFLFFFF